ncbi:hypothetical protein [Cellulomonas hominis]|uniref:hypothetical protein n=1 Tax=Cellulomonas hominis TaxID=156981 RepID=UPI001B94CF9C|nr:hypothetical protein [Cellulomonas hominis]VTR76044.1 hypothetical protein CHMI_00800 [Cellulomonas hominis]
MNTREPGTVPRGYRFADHVPYETPDDLAELQGPTSGIVRVRPHIDTSQDPTYDLDDHGDVVALYAAVVRAGSADDQRRLLNRATLEQVWPVLVLPRRCREVWSTRFPSLGELGVQALSL